MLSKACKTPHGILQHHLRSVYLRQHEKNRSFTTLLRTICTKRLQKNQQRNDNATSTTLEDNKERGTHCKVMMFYIVVHTLKHTTSNINSQKTHRTSRHSFCKDSSISILVFQDTIIILKGLPQQLTSLTTLESFKRGVQVAQL